MCQKHALPQVVVTSGILWTFFLTRLPKPPFSTNQGIDCFGSSITVRNGPVVHFERHEMPRVLYYT